MLCVSSLSFIRWKKRCVWFLWTVFAWRLTKPKHSIIGRMLSQRIYYISNNIIIYRPCSDVTCNPKNRTTRIYAWILQYIIYASHIPAHTICRMHPTHSSATQTNEWICDNEHTSIINIFMYRWLQYKIPSIYER